MNEREPNINLRSNRIWEIDLLRGIAIVLMVLFHIMFDLHEFSGYLISYHDGWIYWVGKIAVILFMLVSGISHCFTRSDLKRGFVLLSYALLVTVCSFLFDVNMLIVFGILHFFAFCILTTPLWRRISTMSLSILILIAWSSMYWIHLIPVSTNWFAWAGFYTDSFTSGDYYPVLPWIGWYWLGMVIGRHFYRKKQSLIPMKLIFLSRENVLQWIGKHSIWIYLIHQPIIVGVLTLLNSK